MSNFNLDLSEHENPADFHRRMVEKYPDSNVSLTLNGDQIKVAISDKVPLQMRIDINSFLFDRVKEEVC